MTTSQEHVQNLLDEADFAREKKNLNDAIASYTAAISTAEQHSEFPVAIKATAYSNRSIAYREMGNHEQALADSDMAVELNPNDADLYCNRGNARIELDDLDQAFADFEKALELLPDYYVAIAGRGAVYYGKGEYLDAIQEFDRAIELSPNNAKLYNNRGLAYDARKVHILACKDFRKALEIDPKFTEATVNLGRSELLQEHKFELRRLRQRYEKFLSIEEYTSRQEQYQTDAEGITDVIEGKLTTLKIYYYGLLASVLGLLCAYIGEWLQFNLLILPFITAAAGVCSFPLIWDIRTLKKEKVRLMALSQDAYTKGELVTLVTTDDPKIQKDLLLKLFEHHAQRGSAQLLIDLENNTKSDSGVISVLIQQLKDNLPGKN